jgi:sulfate/thiosulfate transport system permease protein
VILPPAAGAADRLRARLRARVGEYGSVIFIAGNMPMKTEIAPLLIVIKLEEYDYAGATAIAA